MTDISEIVRELKRYAAGHAGPVSPCCQRAADALERFSGRETDGDVKHWIDLLTEGKAVLDSYEMRDLAAVLSRLSAKLETWKLAAHTAEDEVSRLSAETAALQEWKQNQDINWPIEIERRNRELATAEAELAKCGKENCMGSKIEGIARWVREERLIAAEANVAFAVEAEREACARELQTSYPDHAWLNAACAAIRGRVGTPLEGAK